MAFCPQPQELSEWIVSSCPALAERFHVFEIQEPEPYSLPLGRFRLTLRAIARWQCAAAAILRASQKIKKSPDLVFFAWLDSYLSLYLTHHVVDRIFPYNWSGLYFRPGHLRLGQKLSAIRRGPLNPDAVLKSCRCLAVAVLDEGITEKLCAKSKGKLVIVFPDIADASPPDSNFSVVKQIQDKACGRKVIGLLGSLAKRKGFLTLLEVAQKTEQENWFFVFAGQLVERTFLPEDLEKIQAVVKSAPDNCHFHFDHIPGESQFNALVNVCDILFAVYINFLHSSNILTKASVFEKPVLVSNKFCMGERVHKFNLGCRIDENNVPDCIEALHYLFHSLKLNSHQVQPNFQGYRAFHSTEQLCGAFRSILAAVHLT